MRILYLSQYFPPEVGATQTRAYEMARGLVEAGHEVTMLTEVPNHPAGVVHPEYRRKLYVRRKLDGIDVIHNWVLTSPAKTTGTRLAFYLSYMAAATLSGLVLARQRYDLVYATSPPLFTGGAGLALSQLRRLPFVFEVRDLWPESAVELGEIAGARAIRWASSLAQRCYRQSRKVVVVTRGIHRRLLELGVPQEKIELIPNGANTDLFRPQPAAAQELRASLGLEEAFVVIYAGILGVAQGLETVLDAAALLRDVPDVQFLLVGTGPREAALRAYQGQLRLANVRFLGQQAREAMPAFLSAADVALVPLRDVPLFRGALPSKMFDAWACGCPTIVTVPGEAAQVVREAGAGRVVKPENPEALATEIRRLREERAELRLMGEKGRAFVVARYSRQAQARELERLLLSVSEK